MARIRTETIKAWFPSPLLKLRRDYAGLEQFVVEQKAKMDRFKQHDEERTYRHRGHKDPHGERQTGHRHMDGLHIRGIVPGKLGKIRHSDNGDKLPEAGDHVSQFSAFQHNIHEIDLDMAGLELPARHHRSYPYRQRHKIIVELVIATEGNMEHIAGQDRSQNDNKHHRDQHAADVGK
jgi:hypothetical protein